MAVTLTDTARNAACDAVVDLLDGGTIEFQTSGDVAIGSATFGTPAFGASVSGVATANAITAATVSTDGTIAKAAVKNSGGTVIMTLSVTLSGGGGDVEINAASLSFVTGNEINVNSMTYTQPAS